MKEDAWQIYAAHYIVIWWCSSKNQKVNAMQLQLQGIVIFVRFLSFFFVSDINLFGWLGFCYSGSVQDTNPFLITWLCIFSLCCLCHVLVFCMIFCIFRSSLNRVPHILCFFKITVFIVNVILISSSSYKQEHLTLAKPWLLLVLSCTLFHMANNKCVI